MPVPVLRYVYVKIYDSILTTALLNSCHCYPNFTDEKTEAQRRNLAQGQAGGKAKIQSQEV